MTSEPTPGSHRIVAHQRMNPSSWLSIPLLLQTGVMAVVSKLVGPHSARRETLAVLDRLSDKASTEDDGLTATEHGYFDYRQTSSNEDFWLDYVADIGDGFNATHSVAWLLGRDQVFVSETRMSDLDVDERDARTRLLRRWFPKALSDSLRARVKSVFSDGGSTADSDHSSTGDTNSCTARPDAANPFTVVEQPQLQLADCESDPHSPPDKGNLVLPAGQILIMGGDEVYPYASTRNYQHRSIDPYHAARPWGGKTTDQDELQGQRSLFAIPGNHDWYDGLSSFVPNFCQPGRWIGVWRVQQRRSYFSIRLPHGFWLWGIDMATQDEFDAEQLEYFRAQADLLSDNEQVILCVPKPAWLELLPDGSSAGSASGSGNAGVMPDGAKSDGAKSDGAKSDRAKSDVAKSNRFKSDRVEIRGEPDIEPWQPWHKINLMIDLVEGRNQRGATVPLVVSGDLHFYAHHESRDGARHFVVCGGGGAFALGTRLVPGKLDIPDEPAAELTTAFPNRRESREQARHVYQLVWRHRLFCATFAVIMLMLVWLMNTASEKLLSAPEHASGSAVPTAMLDAPLLQVLSEASDLSPGNADSADVASTVIKTLTHAPGTAIWALLILGAFVAFAHAAKPASGNSLISSSIGLVHFVLHLMTVLWLVGLIAAICDHFAAGAVMRVFLYVAGGVSAGWILHGLLLAVYFWMSNRWLRYHEQEIYSSQSVEDYKGFLRMKISADGLVVYPVGLRKIARKWSKAAHTDDGLVFEAPRRSGNPMLWSVGGLLKGETYERVVVEDGDTHVYFPKTPLGAELIESPITIPTLEQTGSKGSLA